MFFFKVPFVFGSDILVVSFLVKPLLVTTWSYWTLRIWDNSRLAFNNLTKGLTMTAHASLTKNEGGDVEQFSTWKAVFCYKVWLLIQDSWKSEPKKEATLRIIGPSKLAILRTLTLLHRFVHPSIGGSKIRSVFKKCEMKLIVALLSLLRKLIHPMWCSKCRWFDSSEVCIVGIGLPPKVLSKWKL